jgi:hypothetical protein
MAVSVSDARSNPNDQIAHAVKVLGKSPQRLIVFKAIYRGKKSVKFVNEISQSTGLNNKQVLTAALVLADNEIVKQIRVAGQTGYQKDRFYSRRRGEILRYVRNPRAFSKLPTKAQPKADKQGNITIRFAKNRVLARNITIDDVDSFDKVVGMRVEPGAYFPMPELRFKKGVKKILGEVGDFQDWGGERNDLFTTRLRVFGRRMPTAFAFKGKGTKKILTPKKMGKNGDQIQRLFKSAASVFIVQYWGQIHESVVEQMIEFARAKSAIEGLTIYYGVIDGDDSNRLIKAYPSAFSKQRQ